MKVSQFYNKNQFLIENNGELIFNSYDSTIAKIDNAGDLSLYEAWDYSKTTLKHLYLFLNDFIAVMNCITSDAIYLALKSSNKKQALANLIKKGIIIKGY